MTRRGSPLWMGAACIVVALGCETAPPDAVANHPLPGDQPGATTVLDEEKLDALRTTLRAAPPPGFTPLRAAPLGRRRWSDVPGAVAAALLTNGAAVVHEDVREASATFTFKTTDGRRGTVEVARVDSPELARTRVRMDAVVDASGFEQAVARDVGENLDAASKRRKVEDYGG